LVIGSFIGPAPLGIYNFSRRLYQMINDVLAGGFTSVSYSLLSSLQTDKAKVREAFLLASFGCFLVSVPAFMGLAAVADDALPLIFGPHWAGAIWPTRWFCVIGLMGSVGIVQSSLINSQGRSDWWFYYQLIRNIATVGLIFLLKDYGIATIVFAIAVQVVVLWPITLVLVARIVEMTVWSYFGQFVRPLFANLIMLAVMLVIGHAMRDASAASRLVVEILAGGLVYLTMIMLICRDRVMVFWNILSRAIKRKTGVA
ncbi:MAG: lipopolysaccharide biosynthesis protein, partial [Alphaproteobacteria bacterium]